MLVFLTGSKACDNIDLLYLGKALFDNWNWSGFIGSFCLVVNWFDKCGNIVKFFLLFHMGGKWTE